MGSWKHAICRECWLAAYGDYEPYKGDGGSRTCCLCGSSTTDGIYVRRDPETVPYPSQG